MMKMDCHIAETLLSACLDGELTDAQQRRLDAHLSQCPNCARQLDALRQISVLYRDLPEPPLPEGLKARLLEQMRQEAPPPEPSASPRPWLSRLPNLVFGPWPALAGAMAVFLAVALLAQQGYFRSDMTDLPAILDQQTKDEARPETAPTDALRAAPGEEQEGVAALSFSDAAPDMDLPLADAMDGDTPPETPREPIALGLDMSVHLDIPPTADAPAPMREQLTRSAPDQETGATGLREEAPAQAAMEPPTDPPPLMLRPRTAPADADEAIPASPTSPAPSTAPASPPILMSRRGATLNGAAMPLGRAAAPPMEAEDHDGDTQLDGRMRSAGNGNGPFLESPAQDLARGSLTVAEDPVTARPASPARQPMEALDSALHDADAGVAGGYVGGIGGIEPEQAVGADSNFGFESDREAPQDQRRLDAIGPGVVVPSTATVGAHPLGMAFSIDGFSLPDMPMDAEATAQRHRASTIPSTTGVSRAVTVDLSDAVLIRQTLALGDPLRLVTIESLQFSAGREGAIAVTATMSAPQDATLEITMERLDDGPGEGAGADVPSPTPWRQDLHEQPQAAMADVPDRTDTAPSGRLTQRQFTGAMDAGVLAEGDTVRLILQLAPNP